MKISASFLSIRDNFKPNVERLCQTKIDYIHIDIMDGKFVPVKSWNVAQINWLLENTSKLKDVHLMVEDVKGYVDDFSRLHPEFITFHYEVVDDVKDTINYIKAKGCKVGMAIKPNTKVEEIYQYLPFIDLVLVMSVEPGRGGQQFMLPSVDKINKLSQYRSDNGFTYLIEVDGGINNTTINLVRNVDIAVVGSYITNNPDYDKSVNSLLS